MIRWVERKARFGGADYMLMCGAVQVGHAGWNMTRSRNDSDANQYVWRLYVTGREERGGHGANLDQVKASAEAAFANWLRLAGLTQVPVEG